MSARKKPRPRYYTTDVAASRSVLEIGELLGAYGARSFGWRADPATREPKSVYFVVPVDGVGDVPVELEAKVKAIEKRLYPSKASPSILPHDQRIRPPIVRGPSNLALGID